MSENNRLAVIVRAYDTLVIRLYCYLRFQIIHQRFLNEVGQYFPEKGKVLDVGCGFGLFSLYYASTMPGLAFYGVDRNSRRIATAMGVAEKLKLTNTHFLAADVSDHQFPEDFNAAYMLDIIHHIPTGAVRPLLEQMHRKLAPGGCLIIKDVNTKPAYKRWFTWWLDKAMDYKTPVHYWEISELTALLRAIGFTVYSHQMLDYLPYPHVIYICRKA